jgi:hypothetical protein
VREAAREETREGIDRTVVNEWLETYVSEEVRETEPPGKCGFGYYPV